MRHAIAALALILVTPFVRSDDNPPDPIKTTIDKAWVAYRAEVDKADQLLTESLEKAEKSAREKGDKVALDRVKLERLDFELTGRAPTATPVAVQHKLSVAQRDLVAAYVQSVKAYTKASKDAKADLAQKELDELRKAPPRRYFALLNKKSGLVMTPNPIAADRGGCMVQAKDKGEPYQQWWFEPHNQPGVYLIRNRLKGHFLNIGGNHELGKTFGLWTPDAAEHNHWLISREDRFFRLRDANGEGYLAPEDASKNEDKPILKCAKADGEEQLWRLLPVKPR